MKVLTEEEEKEVAKYGNLVYANMMHLLASSGSPIVPNTLGAFMLSAAAREIARMGFLFSQEIDKMYKRIEEELALVRSVRSGADPKVFVDFVMKHIESRSEEEKKQFIDAIKEL